MKGDKHDMKKSRNINEIDLQVNSYINATLNNGYNIDGIIDSVNNDSFMIDDDISGDIFIVNFQEVKQVNEYIQ